MFSICSIIVCSDFCDILVLTRYWNRDDAGWSSLEARRAHNPKVASSSLAPATELQGVIAQLGEHLPYKQVVTGSSPVGPKKDTLTDCVLTFDMMMHFEI